MILTRYNVSSFTYDFANCMYDNYIKNYINTISTINSSTNVLLLGVQNLMFYFLTILLKSNI